MHDMDLLFLDEPTVGLDPSARRMLLDHIKKHVKSGLTVFFTTHIMEEAEYLCDEIAIIDNGTIIAFDTPIGLKQRYGRMNKSIEIIFKENLKESFVNIIKDIVKENERTIYKYELDNYSSSEITLIGENAIKIKVSDIEKVISDIFQVVPKNGMEIENISVNSPSLEEIFLSIVGNSKDKSNIR
jgi:ABC-2 type transport system ATP-binding protein